MAVKYVITKATNLKDPETPVFAARIKQIDHLGMQAMAKMISDQCSVTSSDVVGTFHNLLYALNVFLLQGRIVRLNQFGTFRMVLKGETAADANSWKPSMIRGARILFTPGAMLQSALRGAEFRSAGKSGSLLEESPEETGEAVENEVQE